ncbi:hypothetical protein [Bacillus sinesaloumensis]|uniref:hypothetical protein n=1 Tax=Litchfieldia sinesaloumensis TaxID=1926280 RepID=UPI000988340A|nr:hypothetical protein [Bacillus sinesaloumensis]
MKKKDMIWLVVLGVITLYFGSTLVSYFRTGDTLGIPEFLLIIGLVIAWSEVITWGTRREVQKDEMGKEIIKKSNHISYNILFISLLIIWIIDYLFLGNEKNYPLFIALCLAYIINPVAQFILVKKHIG